MDTNVLINSAAEELKPEIAPPPPPPPPSPETLLALQFTGTQAGLRPLYDALYFLTKKVGPGTKVLPTATHVAFARNGIPFAAVKVSASKLEFGLALPDLKPASPRWKKSRSLAGVPRLTHKVEVTVAADVNGELVQWVKAAYERAKPAPETRPELATGTPGTPRP